MKTRPLTALKEHSEIRARPKARPDSVNTQRAFDTFETSLKQVKHMKKEHTSVIN
jgi:hypothetical protein